MDYYEELGIDRSATEEEIRRAHRRLTKLLHPDQQTDEAMKQLAEAQMRRLNSVVETLSDPQRRQEYDEELRRGLPGPAGSRRQRGLFHSWPWWVGSTVGAIVLTVGAVWFWADRWGSSFGDRAPTYIPSGAEISSEPSRTSSLAEAPPSPAPTRTPGDISPGSGETPVPAPTAERQATVPPSRTVASVPTLPAEGRPADRSPRHGGNAGQKERSSPTVQVAEAPRRKILALPLAQISARAAAPAVNLPTAPALSASAPSHGEPVPLPAGSLPSAPGLPEPAKASHSSAGIKMDARTPADALEGEWVYAPTEPEKRKAGFYPPEYIDLKIWNDSGLRGEYRARYHVAGKPIPPDVNFDLSPDGNARHFSWSSNNGSKGTLAVTSMDASSIRIEWRTTVFSRGPALTAGTATLVRRTP